MFEEVTPVLGIRRCRKACIGEIPHPTPPPTQRSPLSADGFIYSSKATLQIQANIHSPLHTKGSLQYALFCIFLFKGTLRAVPFST